jgi:Mg2+/Co2+ transporter CorC
VQEAAGFLQAVLTSANPDELLQANADMIDDTFMAVLTANIQEADRQGNTNAANRLKDVYQRVVNLLRNTMQPELRFINELLSTPTDDEARDMIVQQAGQYGQGLLDMMDAVEDILVSRGEAGALERLAFLREEAQQVIK